MLIETVTFHLAADTDESAFLDADKRVQTEFLSNQPGFLRRTTARGHDGEWLVVVLWNSENDADSCMSRSDGHPATMAFTALLDGSTLRTNRYETLD
jgi:heme-degrading monooxygenase HmoA